MKLRVEKPSKRSFYKISPFKQQQEGLSFPSTRSKIKEALFMLLV